MPNLPPIHPAAEAARQLEEVAVLRHYSGRLPPGDPERRRDLCDARARLAIAPHLMVRRAIQLLPKDYCDR
jgi:hypothetical protein